MENAKRKICLITNWYPTKENPYQGVFFKEQIQALEDYFEFVVVHYNEKRKDSIFRYMLRKIRGKNISVNELQKEKNTVEYNAVVYFPKYKKYTDKLGAFIKRRFRSVARKKQNVDEISPALKRRKEAVTEIFHKYFFHFRINCLILYLVFYIALILLLNNLLLFLRQFDYYLLILLLLIHILKF